MEIEKNYSENNHLVATRRLVRFKKIAGCLTPLWGIKQPGCYWTIRNRWSFTLDLPIKRLFFGATVKPLGRCHDFSGKVGVVIVDNLAKNIIVTDLTLAFD